MITSTSATPSPTSKPTISEEEKLKEKERKKKEFMNNLLVTIKETEEDENLSEIVTGYSMASKEIEDKYFIDFISYTNPSYSENKPPTARAIVNRIDYKIKKQEPLDEEIKTLYLYFRHKDVVNFGNDLSDEEITSFDEEANLSSAERDELYEKNKNLFHYQQLIDYICRRDYIAGISPDYSGFLSEEIVPYCIEYFGSKEEWQKAHQNWINNENNLLNAVLNDWAQSRELPSPKEVFDYFGKLAEEWLHSNLTDSEAWDRVAEHFNITVKEAKSLYNEYGKSLIN